MSLRRPLLVVPQQRRRSSPSPPPSPSSQIPKIPFVAGVSRPASYGVYVSVPTVIPRHCVPSFTREGQDHAHRTSAIIRIHPTKCTAVHNRCYAHVLANAQSAYESIQAHSKPVTLHQTPNCG
ncbi:hypothetical protein FA95DRAFT_1561742 [Auriscalpium vulgare]|uniref:Uncharacterized protein n=1 Tax=Auriscalpium vulgare TaxID=40419 RepID=A0ACB8RLH4_9AGAM|nr:hypothetical protein FA95DRAFT_1561742 [Auriscalpium vulgare]